MAYSSLSSYDVTQLRQTQTQHMSDTVAITRIVRVADGMGGFTTGTATSVDAAAVCTITPGAQVEKGGQADRGVEVEMWTVTFPWGTDVQDADLLTFGSITLQVVDAKVAKTRGTAVRCTADVVKGGAYG